MEIKKVVEQTEEQIFKDKNRLPPSSRCRSCNTELLGEFCSTCGQKTVTKRLTLKNISTEVLTVFTNIERGFLYTIWMLFKAPGKVMQDYLSGATKRYYNPFRLVFILATVSALLMVFSQVPSAMKSNHETNHAMFEKGYELGSGGKKLSEEAKEKREKARKGRDEFVKSFETNLKKYMNLLIVSSVPFMAFFSWLFFRQMPYNYAEHLAAMCFMQSAILVFNILLTPFYYFGMSLFVVASVLYFLFMYLYSIYAYKDWLNISWGTATLKSSFINFIGFTVYFILFFVVVLVGVLMMLAMKKSAATGLLIG